VTKPKRASPVFLKFWPVSLMGACRGLVSGLYGLSGGDNPPDLALRKLLFEFRGFFKLCGFVRDHSLC